MKLNPIFLMCAFSAFSLIGVAQEESRRVDTSVIKNKNTNLQRINTQTQSSEVKSNEESRSAGQSSGDNKENRTVIYKDEEKVLVKPN